MRKYQQVAALFVIITTICFIGCSGGDDDDSFDVSGTWQCHLVHSHWTDDITIQFTQRGSAVSVIVPGMQNATGNLDGRHLVMTIPGTGGEEDQILNISFEVDGKTFQGTLTEKSNDVETTVITGTKI